METEGSSTVVTGYRMKFLGQDRLKSLRRTGRRGATALSVLALVFCAQSAVLASAGPATQVPLEYQLKAAFLYKFIKFIEWPEGILPDADGSVVVGVLGESPVAQALDAFQGKEILGHGLRVRKLGEQENPASCHVLFLSKESGVEIEGILDWCSGSPVLTVGETEGFAAAGGMINFVIADNKIGFEINPDAALEADLKISSKLLRLARIVDGRE